MKIIFWLKENSNKIIEDKFRESLDYMYQRGTDPDGVGRSGILHIIKNGDCRITAYALYCEQEIDGLDLNELINNFPHRADILLQVDIDDR